MLRPIGSNIEFNSEGIGTKSAVASKTAMKFASDSPRFSYGPAHVQQKLKS
ncbi:hypothetical protein LMANV2_280026 [Leptospira interrogans serovar Manilae]|uniref:Uncharacterized protein n=1 Tax=Leptospira interrogans serovar Manilae TaxID=214675 RepID=A0AAQ1NXG8_LEPIR|nr:hypothetical protein [Leptospira interrogans]SOR61261.1 hypothetical protein LMANV2_280026 [Leptospira interrogans serovar Manilae]